MREGSFDGIKMPIVRISSRGGRTLALHTYPDVPGQEVEDQGRVALVYNIDAAWGPDLENIWGSNIYPEGWRLFKQRMDEGGSAIFKHPIWGETKMAVRDWSADEDAARPDIINASLTLVEDSLEPFSIKDSTALSKVGDAVVRAERVDIALQTYEGITTTPFADLVTSFRMLIFAWNSLMYHLESMFSKIRTDIRALVVVHPILNDAAHWDLREEIDHIEADLIEEAAAFAIDFPMFETETIAGDTDLFQLSIKYYGTDARWEDLLAINSSVVSNPSHVPGGSLITHQTV